MLLAIVPLLAVGQGRLYQRYARQADLTVAQVSGFRLSDTVKVDVLIVVADNDKAWQGLLEELQLETADGVSSWLSDTGSLALRRRWDGSPCCRVVVWHERHTVGVYRINSEADYDAIVDYQLKSMSSSEPKKTGRRRQ